MSIAIIAILLAPAVEPTRMEWKVGDVTREALVYAAREKSKNGPPVVFGFHGHGGTMRHAATKFRIHDLWPEAIVVYPQGLPTPGRFDPDGKKPGWQHTPDDQKDRDLKFFDAMLATLKEKNGIDESRVYSTGHSNGGQFTYLLWATRPKVLAAVAPSAAGIRNIKDLPPVPCLHVAGEKDETVPFAYQQRIMEAVRKVNGCAEKGKEWDKGCLLYTSDKGAPFVSFIHPGDHKYPDAAPPHIVRFFKEHAKPAPK